MVPGAEESLQNQECGRQQRWGRPAHPMFLLAEEGVWEAGRFCKWVWAEAGEAKGDLAEQPQSHP